MLRLRKLPVAKNSVDNKGGVSRFSVDVFFVSKCRKVSQASPSLLCFRKFPVAKNSMENKGGIKIFRRKIFVLECRKFS